MGYLHIFPDGIHAVCWGQAANLKNQISKTGKAFTSFSIQYGKDGDTKLYQNCIAFDNQNYLISSEFLNRFEKNDMICVCGYLKKDDYWSERNKKDEFTLYVEMGARQEFFSDSYSDVDEELDLSDMV